VNECSVVSEPAGGSTNTVPAPWAPPPTVVPNKVPSGSTCKSAVGNWPSGPVKVCSVVSAPVFSSLKIVPSPFAPPLRVLP
jgi:hypothetical protein